MQNQTQQTGIDTLVNMLKTARENFGSLPVAPRSDVNRLHEWTEFHQNAIVKWFEMDTEYGCLTITFDFEQRRQPVFLRVYAVDKGQGLRLSTTNMLFHLSYRADDDYQAQESSALIVSYVIAAMQELLAGIR